MKNKNFVRKRQAIYISPNKKSTRIIKTLMDFFFFIKVKIKMVCFSVPSQRHGGCGENCRCADDPDRELPKIQSQRNRMDGAAVMGGLQTAGQPAGGCETESRLGGMADGIPPEMDGHSMWAKEPAQIPYLISDPPANVAKRLKTLGNAVVPPQVYPILRYIAEIETGRCRNRQQGGDRIWNP